MRGRGFTLLEVMVAVAILGLALTAILSAQAGAYASAGHARNISIATGLARCKMVELEEHLMRNGYQELDEVDSGPCCEGDETPNIVCSWKIEKPVLPEPKLGDLDLKADLNTAIQGGKSAAGSGQLNPLGLVGSLGQGEQAAASASAPTLAPTDPSLLSVDGGVPLPSASGAPPPSNGLVGGLDAMGLGGLTSMVMGMVYPQIKTIFEASTRRITVTLTWTEGAKSYSMDVSQWVTNPQQGGLVGEMPGEFDQNGPPGAPSGSATGGFLPPKGRTQ